MVDADADADADGGDDDDGADDDGDGGDDDDGDDDGDGEDSVLVLVVCVVWFGVVAPYLVVVAVLAAAVAAEVQVIEGLGYDRSVMMSTSTSLLVEE